MAQKKGNVKKHMLGAFYTPSSITGHMAKMAIEARLLDVLNTKGTQKYTSVDQVISDGPPKDIKLLVKTLTGLSILDPACGEGAFLLSCLTHLETLWDACLSRSKDLKGALKGIQVKNIKRTIVTNNLYGVDLEERAVSRCRKALAREAAAGVKAAESLSSTIKHGNSLLGYVKIPQEEKNDPDKAYLSFLAKSLDAPHVTTIRSQKLFHWSKEFPTIIGDGGFDIIIGNPPYGDRALSDAERTAIKASYSLGTTSTDDKGKGSVNPSSVFVERAFDILAQGGELAFIVPASFARVREFQRTRRFLMDHMVMWHMVDEGSPFKGVTLEMMTIIARKCQPPDDLMVEVITHRPHDKDDKTSWKVPSSVFRRYDRFMLFWDELFERLTSGAVPGLISSRRGPTIPKEHCSSRKDKTHPVPLLVSGKAVQRYRLVDGEFSYSKEEALTSPESITIRTSSLLVGARLMDHYRVCIKPPGMMIGDNVARLDFDPVKVTPEALCVILNSSLMHYIVRRYLFNESQLTMFMQSVAESTPITLPLDMALFTTVGRYMLALGEHWPETKTAMEALDQLVIGPLVYELYLFETGVGLSTSIRASLPQESHRSKASQALLAQDLVAKLNARPDHRSIIERINSEPIVRSIEAYLSIWRKGQ